MSLVFNQSLYECLCTGKTDSETNCLLLCLTFPTTPSRQAWYTAHNCEPPFKQSGGWSAHGQPVDQVHAQYRAKIRELDLQSCQMQSNLRLRPAYESMSIRASGQIERSAPAWMDIVDLSYQAWCKMEKRVFQAAWISCGYKTWADFAATTEASPEITVEDARLILDVFGKLGGTPQRCTMYEWQIQPKEYFCLFQLTNVVVKSASTRSISVSVLKKN